MPTKKGNEPVRILFAGECTYPMYVQAFYHAACRMDGVEAEIFDTALSSHGIDGSKLINQIQYHFAAGPVIRHINAALLEQCRSAKYDIVFLYTCRIIYAKTVDKIRKTESYIAVYNNDDPFSPYQRRYFWRHYRDAIKYSDISYVYRLHNLEDSRREGASRSEMLRAYYIKERNYHIPDPALKDIPEVVYIGHLEDDGRLETIKKIADNGITIGLTASECRRQGLYHTNIVEIEDAMEHYNMIINTAGIAIVFLSLLNRDTYTRRCFEIPATKTMMLAPGTEDILTMYNEDEEIVCYRNDDELLEKLKYYLTHQEERERIGEAGYRRLMRDGHEASDRVWQIILDYRRIGCMSG